MNLVKTKTGSKKQYDSETVPLNRKIRDAFTENNNVILETETGEWFAKHKGKIKLVHC